MKLDYTIKDVVVCIDPTCGGSELPALKLNGLYTIEAFEPMDTCVLTGLSLGVVLREVGVHPTDTFCACGFRLAYRPDTSVTLERTIPTPTKQPHNQDA